MTLVQVVTAPPAEPGASQKCEPLKAAMTAATRPGAPNDPWVHPVTLAGITQHRLAWIHPFVDGNGRTARMLTTLLLHQRGYDFRFLFELSTYYTKNLDDYYTALRTADADSGRRPSAAVGCVSAVDGTAGRWWTGGDLLHDRRRAG